MLLSSSVGDSLARPIPTWLRALFLINVVLLAPQGIGFFSPANIPFPVAVTPLNARFIGALYLAAAVGMILSALGADLADLRIFLFAFAFISILVLIVTFVYWGEFTAKRIPLIWLATYIVDPIAATAALLTLRPLHPARPSRHRLSAIFLLTGLVFGGSGLVMLAAPALASTIWPWKITALLAQVYGAFLFSFGGSAVLAAWEARPSAVRPFVASTVTLAVLTVVASLIHLDRFAPGIASLVWFIVFAIALVAFAGCLVVVLGSRGHRSVIARSAD
ncbi:MAG TPA: hypothetical protein VFZ25_14380 [Chloroflexota bacterium]|nr:hypothetical protein [Chloroflexota bacterium]